MHGPGQGNLSYRLSSKRQPFVTETENQNAREFALRQDTLAFILGFNTALEDT